MTGNPIASTGVRLAWTLSRRGLAPLLLAALLLAPGYCRADVAVLEDEKYQKSFDTAIDRALAYLAQAQMPDGSFPGGMPQNTAVASLSVMAFLARGYSPGLPPYGDTINRGVDFVLSAQAADGTIIGPGGGQMYSHNISTLMLAEVSGMVDPERQKRVDECLAKALRVILAAQDVAKGEANQGGWRYAPNATDSDISQSGWALMALRAARNNGAAVPKEAIDRAVRFVMRCHSPQDGGFCYTPGSGSGLARTGVGLLCLELSGKHRDEVTLKAGEYIATRFKAGWQGEIVYYCLYYCSQGMFQLGGEEWQKFAPELYDAILQMQGPDGSWPSRNGNENSAGSCYCTSMAVLALSVSYRQLPIYQR